MMADKQRIITELNLASRIQESMLPSVFPPFPERTEFGLYASMTPAMDACADGSPEEILAHVKRAVDDFVGDAEPFDDLTMLCLEYLGPPEAKPDH